VFDLTGRVALVTGAGQGVGAGIARSLASQGAAVGVNDLVLERARATADGIAGSGGKAAACAFDVGDTNAVTAGVAEIEAELGPLDILVNNAGVPPGMGVVKFRETRPADWKAYIDLNLYGVMNCCKAVVDGMCDRGWGRIITISSGAGTTGLNLGVSAYAAGKGGGISFMRHLALETAEFGVTANTLALGLIDNQADPSITEHLARTIPAGFCGQPEDIGPCCVYLASNEARWMTGQTIGLNGGSTTS
jgi:NAD(P)-dependent dehydrogenase (short-subunit alcohol dehydrogenase family)